jgi:hypothetical protein
LGGRVRIFRSPLLAETGDESVPYPFRSQMAKVEHGEVRRMPRPRRSVNKGKKKGLRILLRPSWAMGTYGLG